MYQARIDTTSAVAITTGDALFTPLERTVLELARRERGRGLLPTSGLGRLRDRIALRLFGQTGVRPLADPRLEALRTYVNAIHHCSKSRVEAAGAILRSVGFDSLQESWIRSTVPLCA